MGTTVEHVQHRDRQDMGAQTADVPPEWLVLDERASPGNGE